MKRILKAVQRVYRLNSLSLDKNNTLHIAALECRNRIFSSIQTFSLDNNEFLE